MRKILRNTASRRRASSKPRDALDLVERMIGSDQGLREEVERATLNALVAQLIYRARTEAGLTQTSLAKLIGTRQSVISRLEDADYEGHSLSMLNRIALALGKRLQLRLVSIDRRAA